MDSTVSVDQSADLAGFQSEGRLFEGLLHIARAEPPEVPALGSTSALTVLLSNPVPVLHALDLAGELLNIRNGFVLAARDGLVAVAVVGVATAHVLLENVLCAHLIRLCHLILLLINHNNHWGFGVLGGDRVVC